MKIRRNNTNFAILLGIAMLTVGTLSGCKEKPQSESQEQDNPAQYRQNPSPEINPAAKPTISAIVARARYWRPIFTGQYGKPAPDFTVTDLAGEKHTLNQYRGKNVILNFWATWCKPCIVEIPHLIELQNSIGEDKLAILAISYITPMNSAEKIRKFVAARPAINYTVIATDMEDMPKPYNLITGIPSSFFIDPQGKIKLATEGLIPLQDIKAIIEAER